MTPPRELRTPRLTLRPPRAADAPLAHARWDADPQVLRYLDWRPAERLEQTRARLAWDEARWLKGSAWTWLLLPDQHAGGDPSHPGGPDAPVGPVGLISLTPQRLDGPAHHARLGYLLAPAWQGCGLMHEALQAVCHAAWFDPALQRLDALCDVGNHASRALLERLGWPCEGRLRRHSVLPNLGTAARDVWLFATVRPEPAGIAGTTTPS